MSSSRPSKREGPRGAKGEGPRGNAYDGAVRILGVRDHSRFELGQKLRQRGFENDDIDDALNRLEEHGYLDDERFARLVMRQYSDRGRRGVSIQMEKRGIPGEIYRPLLEEIGPDEEHARAAEALEKRTREVPPPGPERQRWKARMAGYLGRRGFSSSVIMTALEEAVGREDDY